MPTDLRRDLIRACVTKQKEETPEGYVWGTHDDHPTEDVVYLYAIPDVLRNKVDEFVRARIQEWIPCATNLELTSMYGPREYLRGAVLRPHVDRSLTHFLSAILHVKSSGLSKPWLLDVWPHDGGHETIDLSSSEDVVLYESAVLPHGRMQALEGDSYTNLFVHYRTPWWEAQASDALK